VIVRLASFEATSKMALLSSTSMLSGPSVIGLHGLRKNGPVSLSRSRAQMKPSALLDFLKPKKAAAKAAKREKVVLEPSYNLQVGWVGRKHNRGGGWEHNLLELSLDCF